MERIAKKSLFPGDKKFFFRCYGEKATKETLLWNLSAAYRFFEHFLQIIEISSWFYLVTWLIYQVFNGYFTCKSLAGWRERQNIQLRVVRALWPMLFKANKRAFMITKNALKYTFPLLLKFKILMPAEATPKPFNNLFHPSPNGVRARSWFSFTTCKLISAIFWKLLQRMQITSIIIITERMETTYLPSDVSHLATL